MIDAAADRATEPAIEEIHDHWRVRGDRRMQAERRLPGFVAYTCDVFIVRAGRLQRKAAAVAGE